VGNQYRAQSQLWCTEPEIDIKRQQELERCRAIVPDIEKGIYPFKGMQLSRADVEWLLAPLHVVVSLGETEVV